MKCEECDKELTQVEIKRNNDIAKSVKRLDYCSECWDAYCEHAMYGV